MGNGMVRRLMPSSIGKRLRCSINANTHKKLERLEKEKDRDPTYLLER